MQSAIRIRPEMNPFPDKNVLMTKKRNTDADVGIRGRNIKIKERSQISKGAIPFCRRDAEKANAARPESSVIPAFYLLT